jgi:hypothetical protein
MSPPPTLSVSADLRTRSAFGAWRSHKPLFNSDRNATRLLGGNLVRRNHDHEPNKPSGRASKGRGVIPVEVTQTPWATFWAWVDHWQTLIAGFLALLAAFGTIWMTSRIANRQITASREEAKKVIAATREQTATTVRLEQEHDATEASAFRAMLEAAMRRVLAEAAWARKTYPDTFKPTTDEVSVNAGNVRNCITKGAFAELRTACVRQGSPLTGKFLDLEMEIDNFALQCGTYALSAAAPMPVRKGMHAGLGEQLTLKDDLTPT